jgi:hypothetical protein
LNFTKSIAEDGLRRALYVAIAEDQEAIDVDQARLEAWNQHTVLLSVFMTVDELLDAVLLWSRRSLEDVLDALPGTLEARLRELEMSVAAIDAWRAPFEAAGDGGAQGLIPLA